MYKNGIGVIYKLERLLENGAKPLFDLELDCVQLNGWDAGLYTRENADRAKETLGGKIRVSSFWAGWSGPRVWDMIDGPLTLGLVPVSYRLQRMEELKKAADFASRLGSPNIATHVGFIPENPCLEGYRDVVQAVRHVALHCHALGLGFNFETGQETPTTLMRCISDVGLDNLGINLDPANLILYGRGNPVDALDIYGSRVRGVHVKDADYPQGDFYRLGEERPLGQGMVNYPLFLPKLLRNGYTGDLYVEREIQEGEEQTRDIKAAIAFIQKCLEGRV